VAARADFAAVTRAGTTGTLSFLGATLEVAGKELRTSLRDRQTTLYTIFLPIVLYPFLFWCIIQGSLFVEGKREHTEVRVGLAAEGAEPGMPGLAAFLERRPGEPGPASHLDRVRILLPRAPLDGEGARAWMTSPEKPDAVLFLGSASTGESAGGSWRAEVFHDSSRPRSQIALGRIQARMPGYIRELRERSAEAAGHGADSLEPFRLEPAREVAPLPAKGAYLLSLILPLLFVIMAVMGAFFPAVDLTCGERERKTAETTLLLPIPRHAVHLGKILAVSAAALLATGLNLTALALSAEHLLGMLPTRGLVQVEVPLAAFLKVAPLLLLFAFFVSSVLTGISALARTFKEGQALLGPVQILFVLPAMAGTLPGLDLSPTLAGIPVVNVVLCFRSLLRGEDIGASYAITALSILALSVAAIGLSIWTLSRESLLVAEEGTAWSRFLGLWHSPRASS